MGYKDTVLILGSNEHKHASLDSLETSYLSSGNCLDNIKKVTLRFSNSTLQVNHIYFDYFHYKCCFLKGKILNICSVDKATKVRISRDSEVKDFHDYHLGFSSESYCAVLPEKKQCS